jgi:hypothetical protein
MGRLRVALLVVAAVVVVAALTAAGKEGVKATLRTSIPLDAKPGTRLRVAWTLWYVDEEGRRQPFGASGVFVRLLSASGAGAEEGFATGGPDERGEYAATVVVPEGGIGEVKIGLRGWRSDASGTRRADALFPITNDPLPGLAASVPGLVYTPGYGNSILMRFDPLTLERTGPGVRLGGNASSWSYSPRRRYLAIASYPQTLSVIDVTTMRSVGRVRLAPGGGVVHAVTWTRRDRVLAIVDTPRGALVVAVDPFARQVVARTQLQRLFAFAFARLPDGLVFLLGSLGRIAPVQIVVVDAEGRSRIAAVPEARIGTRIRGLGAFEQHSPGLAVDPFARKAYLASGGRVFIVDLRTLSVADRGPLRTLAKSIAGTYRSAAWLGGGLMAISGADYAAGTRTPVGLRVVDVHKWTSRTIDSGASSFTLTGKLLLVESAVSRQALRVVAYGFDGGVRYRLELPGSTWMKKQGRRGYACRYTMLRTVVDLRTGALLRQAASADTRCSTLLAGDSRS